MDSDIIVARLGTEDGQQVELRLFVLVLLGHSRGLSPIVCATFHISCSLIHIYMNLYHLYVAVQRRCETGLAAGGSKPSAELLRVTLLLVENIMPNLGFCLSTVHR